ncbi:hypothetical protein M422DRAFT_259996 [Sphaerobolus stellatus SS14]|uniref:Uncharacterized protein n=1 Tax=Sphaerobolus stellatus (strain SS14) TaxID=990650 RepID=A0A0C9URC8_SPHS4|nr:hypothetical protein M422DRAFT_259996 [Sphaerobolus stellatus SS14]
MSVLLSEPYLLSSYATPSRSSDSGPSQKQYLTASSSSDSHGKKYTTLAIEGDGVHLVELSNFHPISSRTLGPLASFASSAITRFDSADTSTSYAPMHNETSTTNLGSKTSKKKAAKLVKNAVHRWRDHHSTPGQITDADRILEFPTSVKDVWAPSSLPGYIIGISPAGDIMVMSDETCKITSSGSSSNADCVLRRSFVFDTQDCTFFRRTGSGNEAVVVESLAKRLDVE